MNGAGRRVGAASHRVGTLIQSVARDVIPCRLDPFEYHLPVRRAARHAICSRGKEGEGGEQF